MDCDYRTGFMDSVCVRLRSRLVEYREPLLPVEPGVFSRILDRVSGRYGDEEFLEITESGEYRRVLSDVARVEARRRLSDEELDALWYHVYRELKGFGELDPVFWDPYVEDVTIPNETSRVYVSHRLTGFDWVATNLAVSRNLTEYVQWIARKHDRVLTDIQPILELYGRLINGRRIRFRVSIDNVSQYGPSLTARLHSTRPLHVFDLLDAGMLSPEQLAYLTYLIEAKEFIVIAGMMGAGKTTTMQALLLIVPPGRKVVTVEDNPELDLSWLPLWQSYVTIHPIIKTETSIEIGIEDLIVASLRDRAEYIVVGEARTAGHVRAALEARSLGSGSMLTYHGASYEDVFNRLRVRDIPEDLFMLIRVVMVMRRTIREGRKVRELFELVEALPTEEGLKHNPVFSKRLGVNAFSSGLKPTELILYDLPFMEYAPLDESKLVSDMERRLAVIKKYWDAYRREGGKMTPQQMGRFIRRFAEELYLGEAGKD